MLPSTARSIPATAAGMGLITLPTGHAVKQLNREFVDLTFEFVMSLSCFGRGQSLHNGRRREYMARFVG
jgi:hypothetical protein